MPILVDPHLEFRHAMNDDISIDDILEQAKETTRVNGFIQASSDWRKLAIRLTVEVERLRFELTQHKAAIDARGIRIAELRTEIARGKETLANCWRLQDDQATKIDEQAAYIARLEEAFVRAIIELRGNPETAHSWYPGDETYVEYKMRIAKGAEEYARAELEKMKIGEDKT